MSNGKKTVITIEAWKRTSFRRRNETVSAWCEQCQAETVMFSPEEFARIHGTVPRMIYRRIESGELHFIDIDDGVLLICGNSPKQIDTGEKS